MFQESDQAILYSSNVFALKALSGEQPQQEDFDKVHKWQWIHHSISLFWHFVN